ncbi:MULTISPECIES: type II toxin-antitoxin system HicB family antitoxin [unclassified Gemella]|uniref:type II toxin-antitoxin system HicB family antitoxin n=1 Tax=unclassified Gemella TaxID=2624949 RepID=UPI001C050BC7|nr:MULTISPECIES: type II toxin-antitoxin system HicB family antitoxin [unclassified Gemella]MBU0279225.1 type II toxin-antitoxin system HicB family antitoxin [Gemella sp. zg-1178]QWQ39330.1 type II toxin-antitoxin system HicB family antitoxin [Gemella sp. zg-570]
MFVVYPAIFYKDKESESFNVVFPDFDYGATFGQDLKEAFKMAQDYICSWLYDDFIKGNKLVKASSIHNIKLENDGFSILEESFVTLVSADLLEYAKRTENKTVRRNVSIPSYLNELVKEKNINVSQILKEALLKEL